MKTVFLLLMIMASPNQPTVKYNAVLYPTESGCELVRAGYMDAYENKSEEYKKIMVTEAFCIPFDAFPIIKTNGIGA